MFSRIANLFRKPVPPLDRLRRLADKYDDRGHDTDTLQGALANAILLVRAEANRNGLLNWGDHDEECVGLLLKYLCDDPAALPRGIADEMRRDLTLIQQVGRRLRTDGAIGYEEVDRVAEQVLDWCEAHPEPILKPAGQDFWYPWNPSPHEPCSVHKGATFQAERAEPYYPRDDRPLIAFTLPHADMVARFGPAHRPMGAEDNEPGPVEYWSFRFPCGLVTFITYHFHAPTGSGGDVTSSSADIGHILQHLPIADCVFWRLDHAEPELYRERYGTPSGICPNSPTSPNDNSHHG